MFRKITKKITNRVNNSKVLRKVADFLVKARYCVSIISVAVLSSPLMSYAASSAALKPLNNAKTFILSICGVAGLIILIYAGYTLAQSFLKMQQGGDFDAVNKLIAAAILIGMDVIVAALAA